MKTGDHHALIRRRYISFRDHGVRRNSRPQALHAEGTLSLYGMTVLLRELNGTLPTRQAEDQGPVGFAAGTLMGGLIGPIGGPAGAAIGMSPGAIAGGFGDIINLRDPVGFHLGVTAEGVRTIEQLEYLRDGITANRSDKASRTVVRNWRPYSVRPENSRGKALIAWERRRRARP